MRTTYGIVTITASRNGDLIMPLPPALVRDFGLRTGDTVTFSHRKAGGCFCRAYRQTSKGWRQLLSGGKSNPVRHPR